MAPISSSLLFGLNLDRPLRNQGMLKAPLFGGGKEDYGKQNWLFIVHVSFHTNPYILYIR